MQLVDYQYICFLENNFVFLLYGRDLEKNRG